MKVATVFALLLVSANAFTAPQFATRAVGPAKKAAPAKAAPAKAAPAKKVVAKKAAPAPKVVAKKAAPAPKVVAKKAAPAPKKVVAKKPIITKIKAVKTSAPPASKGYPSFAAGAQSFRLGKINGGGAGKVIEPVFIHPTINTAPPPSFDYKTAAKARLTKNKVFAYDDGLTELERKQRATIPAFLTGSAKSNPDLTAIRSDIEEQEYPFGLSADRFQLLFISIFGIFTLVGCLSGSIQLD